VIDYEKIGGIANKLEDAFNVAARSSRAVSGGSEQTCVLQEPDWAFSPVASGGQVAVRRFPPTGGCKHCPTDVEELSDRQTVGYSEGEDVCGPP
jgi:hypothetical protein